MNPFDYSKAITDFWAAQGRAMVKAQEQAGAALAEGMKAVTSGRFPAVPSLPADLSSGAAELAAASRSVMDLWSAATAVCAKLATTLPRAGGDGIAEATFRNIVDPRNWIAGTGEIDDVLGRMAEGPRFADLWEAERRYAGVLQAWMNVRRRALEHNAVVLQAWLQAGRQFTEQLAGRSGPDAKLDAKGALALWTDTANRHLLESQRSEPFLQSQAEMIRATTELRMAQQELVEHFGKQYGFPTRTELDDVHRTVTELRRELRAMRRELQAAAAAHPKPELSAQAATPPAEREPPSTTSQPAAAPAAQSAPATTLTAAPTPTQADAPAPPVAPPTATTQAAAPSAMQADPPTHSPATSPPTTTQAAAPTSAPADAPTAASPSTPPPATPHAAAPAPTQADRSTPSPATSPPVTTRAAAPTSAQADAPAPPATSPPTTTQAAAPTSAQADAPTGASPSTPPVATPGAAPTSAQSGRPTPSPVTSPPATTQATAPTPTPADTPAPPAATPAPATAHEAGAHHAAAATPTAAAVPPAHDEALPARRSATRQRGTQK